MPRRGSSSPQRPLAPASAENSMITKRRPAGARKRALGEPAAGGVRAGLGLAAAPQGKRAQVRSRGRSEEHTSELQSLMRISYAVFCLKNKKDNTEIGHNHIRKQTLHKLVHTRPSIQTQRDTA